MKNINKLILITFIIFISCNKENIRENTILIEDFPVVKSLKGEEIKGLNNEISPTMMGLKDSILILCDFEADTHFYVYKVPKFEFLGSFGKQGKDPNNIEDPIFSGQFLNNENPYEIVIHEVNKLRISIVDVMQAINNPNYEHERHIIMPPTVDLSVFVLALNDNRIIGAGPSKEGEFYIYNTKTEAFTWIDFLIDYDEQFMKQLKDFQVITDYKEPKIKIKPDGSKFVKCNMYVPIIDVYNKNTELEFSIELNDYTRPTINENRKKIEGTSKVYYTGLFLTDYYIYALFQNSTSLNEYNENKSKVEIHQFSWDGEAICKYKLNEGIYPYFCPFVVDEANKHIYTVNPINEYNYYRKFNLKEAKVVN